MLNQKDIQVLTSNQFIFCQRPILRWFYPQLLPNTDPKPPTSKYIHILKHTFCSSKYQCLVENILLPDLSIVDAAVCGCHTVAHCTVRWMRCKFNQELGGNLLSKTFLLGSRLRKLGFKCSGSHNSFQTVFTQSFGIQRFLKIDSPFLALMALPGGGRGRPHFCAIADLFVLASPFTAAGFLPSFLLGCVLTRWRHNDVRMFASVFVSQLPLQWDLNYGGKNGVSGHLVTLRLRPDVNTVFCSTETFNCAYIALFKTML